MGNEYLILNLNFLDLSNDFVQKLSQFDMDKGQLPSARHGTKKIMNQIHLFSKQDFISNNSKNFERLDDINTF